MLCVVATPSFAIDMNAQYVQQTNELLNSDSSGVINTAALQRTISGYGDIFYRNLEGLSWNMELHEQFAFDYSALSYAQIASTLSYRRQNELLFFEPWYRFDSRLAYTFTGNPIYYGIELKTTASRQQQVTDSIQLFSALELTNKWHESNDLSSRAIGLYVGADKRVTPKLSVYGVASLHGGKQLTSSTELSEKSIVNRQLTEQLPGSWYSSTKDGYWANGLIGLNMPVTEDLAVDIAIRSEVGTLEKNKYVNHSLLFSALFRF